MAVSDKAEAGSEAEYTGESIGGEHTLIHSHTLHAAPTAVPLAGLRYHVILYLSHFFSLTPGYKPPVEWRVVRHCTIFGVPHNHGKTDTCDGVVMVVLPSWVYIVGGIFMWCAI